MKKMIIGLMLAGTLMTTLVEAGGFGDTFGGTFLGTTGGVVLGNAISGKHREKRRSYDDSGYMSARQYEMMISDLKEQIRDLKAEINRLKDKLEQCKEQPSGGK